MSWDFNAETQGRRGAEGQNASATPRLCDSAFRETEIGFIPTNWEILPLNKVAKYKKQTLNPQSYPEETFDYYSIPAYQVSDRPIPETGSEIRSQKLLVEPGTVMFGKLNPRVPKIWHVTLQSPRRKIASTEFIPLVPVAGRMDAYFLYYLAWSDFILPKSQELVSGSTPSRQRVDTRAFLKIPIPLPPLPEQRRIAHALSAIQQAIVVQEDVIAAARELKRSLMQRLFTYGPGSQPAPTKETEIGEIPEHWKEVELGKLLREQIKNGAFVKRERFGSGTPFLNVADTYDNVSVSHYDGWERVQATEQELEVYGLEPDDLYYVRSSLKREGIGQCCIVEEVFTPAIYDCHLMRVRVNKTEVVPKFLAYYSISPQGKDTLIRRSKTTTMTTINQKGLSGFRFPLPPFREQQIITETLEAIDAKIAAEEQCKVALEALFQSALQQLMTGQIRLG